MASSEFSDLNRGSHGTDVIWSSSRLLASLFRSVRTRPRAHSRNLLFFLSHCPSCSVTLSRGHVFSMFRLGLARATPTPGNLGVDCDCRACSSMILCYGDESVAMPMERINPWVRLKIMYLYNNYRHWMPDNTVGSWVLNRYYRNNIWATSLKKNNENVKTWFCFEYTNLVILI